MRGYVTIDSKGEISSSLPLGNEDTNELGVVIQNILQDVNSYMRMNGNQLGDLHQTTLRLGNAHEVKIVVNPENITALVKEIIDQE